MKCFKVVTSGNNSVVVPTVERTNMSTATWGSTDWRYEKNRFSLFYEVGKETVAPKDTLGLFCFLKKEDAFNFVPAYSRNNFKLLLCEGEKQIKVERISAYVNVGYLEQFYNKRIPPEELYMYCPTGTPVQGTVCFKKVKVLKEMSWEKKNEKN